MKEDIISKGTRLDIAVMERKEKHGTITDGERKMLKSWRRYALNSAVTHQNRRETALQPSVNSKPLTNKVSRLKKQEKQGELTLWKR